MKIVLRLLLGIVLGTVLAIGGYFVGWYTAFSVPAGFPRMLFLVLPAGIGGGVGSFLGWWLDLDGDSDRNKLLTIAVLALAIAFAIGGAWGGYVYGESVEGTRVWRHPTTQAILNGTVIASNGALLVWHIGARLLRRPPARNLEPSVMQSFRTTPPGPGNTENTD